MDLKQLFAGKPSSPQQSGKGSQTGRKRKSQAAEPVGIIDWTRSARLITAAVVAVMLSLVSPVLGLSAGFVIFAGAAVRVEDYWEDKQPELNDFRFRALRFLDALAVTMPFSGRRRFRPTELYDPPPGMLVALFGTGAGDGPYRKENPFLKLTWFPPRRLSFWAATAFGVLCATGHTLVLGWWAAENPQAFNEGAGSLLLLGVAGSAFGGFLAVSTSAEALRWAAQEQDINPDAAPVPKNGYVCAAVGKGTLRALFARPADSSGGAVVPELESLPRVAILAAAAVSGALCGGGYLRAAAAVAPQTAPLAAAAAVAGVVLAGAGLLSWAVKREMMGIYEQRRLERQQWDRIFEMALQPGLSLPLWVSTDSIDSPFAEDLKVSKFLLGDNELGPYRIAEQLGGVLGAAGVVIEGAEPQGNTMKIVSRGACNYLLVYHTESSDLGKTANEPHLRPWETEEQNTGDEPASPLGLFALRLAFEEALRHASIPQMLVSSARQHHFVGDEYLDDDNDWEPVLWEINCKYRSKPITSHQLNQKLEVLRQALRCEWICVGSSSAAGDVQFWMSNCDPKEAELKDEDSAGQLFNVPGGTETASASETRLKLIESEWSRLLSKCLKEELPAGFGVVEQKCWSPMSRTRLLAEATFSALLNTDSMQRSLAAELNATMLYTQTDPQLRQTRISWGLNVEPKSYLVADQNEKIKKETAINAVMEHWQPAKSKTDCFVDVEDVKFHTLSSGADITEIVCRRGTSSPLENCSQNYLTRTMRNLGVKWLRIGQQSGLNPDDTKFSIAFSTDPNPAAQAEPDSPLGKWLYALDRVWSYALQTTDAYEMVMRNCEPLTIDGKLKISRWELPPGMAFHKFALTASRIDREFAEPVMIPGVKPSDLESVYLVGGEHIPADESAWLDPRERERIGQWGWEQMMLICNIQTSDKNVPVLLKTEAVGRTHEHTIELPRGMGHDQIFKEDKKIKSTGDYHYLEMRPLTGRKAVVTTAYEDPLPDYAEMQKLAPRHQAWDFIPIGLGIRPQKESQDGYSPFSICWQLRRAPHMLLAGSTGSGKTSALKVIASEAVSRGFDLRVIDAKKAGADFSGIYEYDLFCSAAAFNLQDAHRLILDTYAEARVRVEDNKKLKVGNWYDRPEKQKPRPVMLIMDETFSTLLPSPGKDEEAQQQNQLKSEMLTTLGNIAREARSAGVHIILVAQRPDAKVMEGEMKNNLGARLLIGQADHIARNMMLPDVAFAPKIETGDLQKGRGIFAQEGTDSCMVQTFWAGTSGEITENLRGVFCQLRDKEITLTASR